MKNPYIAPIPRHLLGALLLLILLAAAPHGLHLSPWISGFFLTVFFIRAVAINRPGALPGRLILFLLTVAGVINVVVHHHTLMGRDAGVALLTVMLGLKLLELKKRRDVYVAIILSFFLIVTQFLFNRSPILALYLLLVVFGFTALLIELNRVEPSAVVPPTLRSAVRLLLEALPIAVLLFLLFPRLSGPLWNFQMDQERAFTGMSEDMSPGSISALSLSRDIAFRAHFRGEAPPPSQRYWRGPVLWDTNGREWSKGDFGGVTEQELSFLGRGKPLRYTVMQEPSGQHWLYALDLPTRVPKGAGITADFQLLADRPIEERKTYSMRSYPNYNTGELAADQRAAALKLPPTITARMRRLVRGWQQSNDTHAGQVAAALSHFNTEPFVYTLSPPLLLDNPADQFLFESRKGFCEHFATSFTLLMRIAGIPARVVAGYQGGELNPMGGYYMIRQSDAHAWSEVWLKSRGWLRVDPTAAVAPERIEHPIETDFIVPGLAVTFRAGDAGVFGDFLRQLGFMVDAANTGWRRWVLDYDAQRQVRLLSQLGFDFARRKGLAVAILITVASLLAIAGTLLIRRHKERADPVQRQYLRFCRRLQRSGLARRPHEGPLAFSDRVICRYPNSAAQVGAIISLYIALRYAPHGTAEQFSELRRRVARFQLQA